MDISDLEQWEPWDIRNSSNLSSKTCKRAFEFAQNRDFVEYFFRNGRNRRNPQFEQNFLAFKMLTGIDCEKMSSNDVAERLKTTSNYLRMRLEKYILKMLYWASKYEAMLKREQDLKESSVK